MAVINVENDETTNDDDDITRALTKGGARRNVLLRRVMVNGKFDSRETLYILVLWQTRNVRTPNYLLTQRMANTGRYCAGRTTRRPTNRTTKRVIRILTSNAYT